MKHAEVNPLCVYEGCSPAKFRSETKVYAPHPCVPPERVSQATRLVAFTALVAEALIAWKLASATSVACLTAF